MNDTEASERLLTVGDLVNPWCDDNPNETTAGLVRSAFVAHTMFFSEAGLQSVQVQQLSRSNVRDRPSIVRMLCETYSRAVFETAFALYFDRCDPQTDVHLHNVISTFYSPEIANEVRAVIAARGVVLGSAATEEPAWRINPRAPHLPAAPGAAPAADAEGPTDRPPAALPRP